MTKQVISTPAAPTAIGPYSQAIRVGTTVWCSGQIALDPSTGDLVSGGVEAEARQVLANLRAVLEAAGATPDQVVRTTIFLTDLGDFARVNAIYGEVFAKAPPARATVQVSALPKGAQVEIDAIAVIG